MINAT
jgi:hypothetical protein